jgi:hypothetical protein
LISPTVYPQETGDTIIVQNHLTIYIHGTDFRELNAKMDELLTALRGSNEIAGEVRDKLIAEMTAGMAILKSPKPDPKMIDLLIKRPLTFIIEKGSGAIIGTLAIGAMMALGKIMGVL